MPEYRYDLQAVAELSHLPDTLVTVSRVTGGDVPDDAEQYYLNTRYRISKDRRNGPDDAGMRMTKGFSVQKQDIPKLIGLLKGIQDGGKREHLSVCDECTLEEDTIVLHRKESADAPSACRRRADHGRSYVVR